jgi:hypothetical protein
VSLKNNHKETPRMDSSETDAIETPSHPSEQDEPSVVQSVPPEDVMIHDMPMELAEPAEPGIYVYESEQDFGIHSVLGHLNQGENDFSEETHPDKLQAIGDMVAAGVLRKA